jgi:transposase
MHGLKVGEIHRNRFENRARDLLEEMPSLNCAIEPLLRILEQLTAERKALDKRLEQTARGDAVCQRLMNIPGVAPITSLAFRVTVDDPSRFNSRKPWERILA